MWALIPVFLKGAGKFFGDYWKPIAIFIVLCSIPWLITLYNSRLINQGKAEVQAVFDKYKSDQAAATKKAQDELSEKTRKLQLAEAEAAQKAEQIKQLTAKELDYEIRTKIVYRNCKLPPSGVQLYKSATSRR